MTAAEQYKHELSRYISDQQSRTIEANTCDYKGTSKHELDEIKSDATRQFERACKLLDGMSAEEQSKLRRFAVYKLRTEYVEPFCSFLLKNNDRTKRNQFGHYEVKHLWYVGPKWLSVYDDFVTCRELTQ